MAWRSVSAMESLLVPGGAVVSRRVGMSTGASSREKAVPALGGTLSACYRHAVAHLPREDRRRTTPERRTGLLVRRVRRALRGIRNEQRWQICRDGGTGRRDGLKRRRALPHAGIATGTALGE